MKQRLIDANALRWRMGVDQDDKQIFYITGEDIDSAPTVNPENLRPMGWWRYNKKTRSWNCGLCGWRNPLMSPDGPSPDGEQFTYCMCCGAKMVGECYEIEKNHLKSIGSDIHK